MLAATLSPSYGIYSGFENCENVPVARGLRGVPELREVRDQAARARRPAAAAGRRAQRAPPRATPALQGLSNITFLETANDALIAYAKQRGGETLLIAVVNLDPHQPQEGVAIVVPASLGLPPASPSTTC